MPWMLFEQVNRLVSLDALYLVILVAVAYHVLLAVGRDWRALAVFHLAGSFNFLLEAFLVLDGTRVVEGAASAGQVVLLLAELSWFDNGFFASLAFVNVRAMYGTTPLARGHVAALNALFFVGLPVASLNWGLTGTTILTRRIVASPAAQQVLQVAAVVLGTGLLAALGYKRLVARLVLMGVAFGGAFQARLYVAGIRQASSMSVATLLVDSATLATMTLVAGAFALLLVGRVDFHRYGDPPPHPAYLMQLRYSLAAVGELRRELGLRRALGLARRMLARVRKGEPWTELPPATARKDVESRAMIGDAIILYRVLKEALPADRAEAVFRKLVLEAAVAQLYSTVPKLSREDLVAKSPAAREALLTEIVEAFPNTDYEIVEASDTTFWYRITRCRYPELLARVGHPELSDVFCAGDGVYFERHQPDIAFARPKNIGKGDACCDFVFTLKDAPPSGDV